MSAATVTANQRLRTKTKTRLNPQTTSPARCRPWSDQLANEEASDQLTALGQELSKEWKVVEESLSPPTLEQVISQFTGLENSDQIVDLGQVLGKERKEAPPRQTPPFTCSNCSAHFDYEIDPNNHARDCPEPEERPDLLSFLAAQRSNEPKLICFAIEGHFTYLRRESAISFHNLPMKPLATPNLPILHLNTTTAERKESSNSIKI